MNAEDKKIDEKLIETKNQEEKLSKQLRTFIIIIIVMLVAVVLFFFFKDKITSLAVGNFNYNGLEFYKTKVGKLTFFTTNIKIPYSNSSAVYVFYFRNDPRKLGRIPFVENVSITKTSYFAFTPSSLSCKDANLVGWNMGEFLGRTGSRVNVGVTETYNNKDVINCSTSKTRTIIILSAGNLETRIYRDPENSNCIILEAKDCRIIEVSERFILGFLLQINALQ